MECYFLFKMSFSIRGTSNQSEVALLQSTTLFKKSLLDVYDKHMYYAYMYFNYNSLNSNRSPASKLNLSQRYKNMYRFS